MQIQNFVERLSLTASELSLIHANEPLFESKHFRGREDSPVTPLPTRVHGMRIGTYPVLVCELFIKASTDIPMAIQELHNQIFVARSYMKKDEVVDCHLFLLFDRDKHTDLQIFNSVEIIERNEAVCRKVAWVYDKTNADMSFEKFKERTFLSRPWPIENTVEDASSAPLDHNATVVQKSLMREGLSEEAALKWITAATEISGNPAELVKALVLSMDDAS